MNQDQLYVQLVIFMVLSMFAGIFFMRSLDTVLDLVHKFKTRNLYPKADFLEESKLCKDSHSWEDVYLALMNMDVGTHKVCTKCGFVSGSEMQINKAGVGQINQTIELKRQAKERQEKSIDRLIEILKADRDMWIKTFVNEFGKSEDKNVEMLVKFSKFTTESLEAATRRVASELKEK